MSKIDDLLMAIFEKDESIYYALKNEKYKNISESELMTILSRLNKKPATWPSKIGIYDNTEQSGLLEKIRTTYLFIKDKTTEEVGLITIEPSASVACDINVLLSIKVLLLVGITPNEEVADACREIVKSIVSLGSSRSYITEATLKERLELLEGDDIKKSIVANLMEVVQWKVI